MTKKLLSLLVALAAIAHLASAAPAAVSSPKALTNSRKRINPVLAHKTFTPFSTPKPGTSFKTLFTAPDGTKPETVATQFVAARLNILASDFRVSDIVPLSNGGSAVHLRQVINGLDVANGNINVNVDGHGRVFSFGDAFFRGARPAAPPTTVAPGEAHTNSVATKVSPQAGFEKLAAAVGLSLDGKSIDVQPVVSVQSVGGKPAQKKWTIKTDAAQSDVPVKYAYIQNGDALKLVYNYVVELDHAWYNAHVDATTGTVEHLADWVADATYSGVPVGQASPDDGGLKTVTAQLGGVIDTAASPFGWHDQGNGKKFTDTRGNNAFAQDNPTGGNNWINNKRPDGGANLDFTKYKPDLSKDPKTYTAGSTAQLFMIANQVHDIVYHYGFDEKSGNFQENNFNKGGKGSDAVIANAQDGSGTNNANFWTPPDGQRPKMRMYTFTATNPGRDGTFDTAVPIHEYGHGISNRLTGGPANADCLSNDESGGMGEGWSDVLAMVLNAKKTDTSWTPVGLGAYVIANAAGIRTYPYSTDARVNPTMYGDLAKPEYKEVHAIGEVWAIMLWEVYWNLRYYLGVSDDLRGGFVSSQKKGDALFLQIMLDAMKIQPCNPTFIQARDAILQAEQNLTGGNYACIIWYGFISRGLGNEATTAYQSDISIPVDCRRD
ncbi:Fungalysin metallopeptidase-domain-containing protein [Blastocladiella britannica]|nr:Fungalysin metallopeptidase-domain-containing protein [Blastocladiella britannica]